MILLLIFWFLSFSSLTHLSVGEGLPIGPVSSLCEDGRGTIWFGAQEGIFRLGKNGFERSNSIPGVNSLFCDSFGYFWFSSLDSSILYRFNPSDNSCVELKFFPKSIRFISSIDRNSVYICSSNSILRFSCDENGEISSEIVIPVAFEPDYFIRYRNSVWISSTDGRLFRSNLDFSVFLPVAKFLEDHTGFSSLIPDEERNVIYASSDSKGLFVVSDDGGSVRHFSVSDGLRSDSVYCMSLDPNGNLWLGTSKGLSIFNPDSSTFLDLGPNSSIKTLLKDSTGEMWAGMDSSGELLSLPYSQPESLKPWYRSVPMFCFYIFLFLLFLFFGIAKIIKIANRRNLAYLESMAGEKEKKIEELEKLVESSECHALEDKFEVGPISPSDYLFLRNVRNIVLANLSDENFGVQQLSEALGLSRSGLHIKIKPILGVSALEYIKYIRFDVAKRLLLEDKSSVSEIAQNTGFSASSYFATAFKAYVGVSPSEYKIRRNQIL